MILNKMQIIKKKKLRNKLNNNNYGYKIKNSMLIFYFTEKKI